MIHNFATEPGLILSEHYPIPHGDSCSYYVKFIIHDQTIVHFFYYKYNEYKIKVINLMVNVNVIGNKNKYSCDWD